MALYAFFFNRVPEGLAGAGRLIEACGDRAVIRLDARHGDASNLMLSKVVGVERGYHGVALYRGPSLLRAVRVTTVHELKPN